MWIETYEGGYINSDYIVHLGIRERGQGWKYPYVISAELFNGESIDIDPYSCEEDAERNLSEIIEILNNDEDSEIFENKYS